MTTHKRKLSTGQAVWADHRRPPLTQQPLERDLKTEVLIVGAGMSGALLADSLTEAGLQVTVVDRRHPTAGSTSASTCLMQSDLDTPLSQLARKVGVEKAGRFWRRSRLALDALAQRARALKLEIQPRHSLYLAGDVLDAKGLQREAAARHHAGLEAEMLTRTQLLAEYGIRRSAALRSGGQYSADPVRLASGMLQAATERGASIYSPVEVTTVSSHGRGVVAETKQGPRIRARYLVFAGGYELPSQVKAKKHQIVSTYAIATKPQRRHLWPTECLIWESSDPYLYLRTTVDGRIVCGGEDEPFSDADARDALLPKKVRALERKLHAMFPDADPTADFQWAGSFGTNDTGTPTMGRVAHLPNCFCVLGYGGNGTTFSMLGAQLIRGLITGEGDADERLFALA